MVDVVNIYIWDTYVGAAQWDAQNQLAYFEYAPNFIEKRWDIAPLKMPISSGAKIYSFPELRKEKHAQEDTFKGLPGLLADALPDRYGNRLIQAWLSRNGRGDNSMNPIERLCFIGKRAMGALEFEPAIIPNDLKSEPLEIETLVELSKRVLQDRVNFKTNIEQEQKALLDIIRVGTSAGGARPKALISIHNKTGEIRSGQGKALKNYEHWLIKFDGVDGVQFGNSSGWGRIEYAYYLMACDCQITMTESKIWEENGRAHFMTKRFDREDHDKHHIQTLCGIQHFDYNDMRSYSYEQIFETMRGLRLTYQEAEQMYRRMIFNVLAVNFDDHTKNFSFIMKKDQKWQLAPAYDLCFAYNPENHWVSQQTLSIQGKKTGITREDILSVGYKNNIKSPQLIYDEIEAVVKNWDFYARKADIAPSLQKMISKTLKRFEI
jgi:serine/threonine-protein kinase HipA